MTNSSEGSLRPKLPAWLMLRLVVTGFLLLDYSSCAYRQRTTPGINQSAPFATDAVFDSLRNTPRISKGYGTFTVAINGERHAGDFEVIRLDSGSQISLYTTFGGHIGSVAATADSGVVTFKSRTVSLSAQQTLDTSGLPFGSLLTLGELVGCFNGKMPFSDDDIDKLAAVTPLKVKEELLISLATAHQNIFFHFATRTGRIKRSIIERFTSTDSLRMSFQHFNRSVSQQITLKADEKNYFSLKFKKIVFP